MSEDDIDYDGLVQGALLGVVRQILDTIACQGGLPGEHHFYIGFRTRDDGVVLPAAMRERYPDEMTIVLQHRYWNLQVFDDRFEVDLSFNQKREHLVIPFRAITGFVDPSVQFALQFQDHMGTAGAIGEAADLASLETSVPATLSDAQQSAEANVKSDGLPDEDRGDDTGKVVTLDAFRKKRSS